MVVAVREVLGAVSTEIEIAAEDDVDDDDDDDDELGRGETGILR